MSLTLRAERPYKASAMQTVSTSPDIITDSAPGGTSCEISPAKWFVTLDDRRIPMPQRVVKVSVVRAQADVPPDMVIVRDHNSPDDEVLADHGEIDCGKGNVLYTMPRCDARPPAPCAAPAKFAFSVDDRVEETIMEAQTARSLLELVGIVASVHLFRDYESPVDQPIGPGERIHFADGPVFYTRPAHATTTEIVVNGEKKAVDGHTLSYDQAVKLAFNPPEPDTIYTVTYKKGPRAKPQGRMVAGDVVEIVCGEHFNVTPTSKS